MALSKIKKLILVEDGGSMVPAVGATCYVYHATTFTLAQMYANRTGTTLASNPATVGADGYLDRYIESGAYDLRVASGLDEATYPDFLAVDDIIISGPAGELQFSDVANLIAATPLNQKSYKVSWAGQLGRKVSTVVHNTTSNEGGAPYVIVNVNPGNLSTLVGGIWVGVNHDLGGGFYAVLIATEVYISMLGCIGDGAKTINGSGQYDYSGTDDSAAFLAALALNSITIDDGFNINLNGAACERGLGFAIKCNLTSSLMNGTLNIRENSGHGLTIGDWNYYDVSVWFGAISSGSANHATGIKIGKSFCEGNSKYRVVYIDGLDHDDIRINMLNDDGTQQEAMALSGIWNSGFGVIHLSGYYSMGFQTIQSSGYATKNTTIKKLISIRDPDAVAVAGKHSFYLLNNYNLQIPGGIFSTGYTTSTLGASHCLKVRDSLKCRFGPIIATTVNIASDANSPTINTLEDNTFECIDTRTVENDNTAYGAVIITTNSPGVMSNNKIMEFHGALSTGTLVSGDYPAITLMGIVDISNTGDLQLTEVYFKDAEVRYLSSETNVYTRKVNAKNCIFNGSIKTNNTDIDLRDCTINGDVNLGSTAGTRNINLMRVIVNGDIITNSAGTRVVNATWYSVVCSNNRQGSSANRPDGVIDFKSVFFADGYYLDQTTFVTPYV